MDVTLHKDKTIDSSRITLRPGDATFMFNSTVAGVSGPGYVSMNVTSGLPCGPNTTFQQFVDAEPPQVGGSFGCGNRIMLFTRKRKFSPSEWNRIANQGIDDTNVITMREWGSTLFDLDPFLTLIARSSSLFSRYHQQKSIRETQRVKLESLDDSRSASARNPQEIDPKAEEKQLVCRLADQYGTALRECYHEARSIGTANPQDDALRSKCDILYQMDLVWSLFKAVFIDISSLPATSTLARLQLWISSHFTKLDNQCERILRTERTTRGSADQDPAYWDVVYGCLLRGDTMSAGQMLRFHSRYASDHALKRAVDLIESMPLYNGQESAFTFQNLLEAWFESLDRALQEELFGPHFPELERAVLILVGDETTLCQMVYLFDAWPQLMVATLVYKDQLIRETNLTELALTCISVYRRLEEPVMSLSEVDPLDQILVTILASDLEQAIPLIADYFEDGGWLNAHLVDLLLQIDLLSDELVGDCQAYREHVLMEWAASLFSGLPATWDIMLMYLIQCPTHGTHLAREYLARIPIDNERIGQRVISAARQFNLQDVIHSVSRQLAKKALDSNLLGSALEWSIKTQDQDLLTAVADKYLEYYVQNGVFPDETALQALSPRQDMLAERIHLLSNYHKCRQLLDKRFFPEAANLLITFIRASYIPPYFMETILEDCLVVLECPLLHFSRDQLRDLHKFSEFLEDEDINAAEHPGQRARDKRLRVIRLELARSMAQAAIAYHLCVFRGTSDQAAKSLRLDKHPILDESGWVDHGAIEADKYPDYILH